MQPKHPLIIDLSVYERDAIWDRQASDPPLLVITRLSLGKSYKDPVAPTMLAGARSIGSKVGVYHFLEYNDIAPQADNFLEAARQVGALANDHWMLDIAPILDVEKEPGGRDDPEGTSWANQIKTWLDLVETATGVRPWIYTSTYYWSKTLDRAGNPPAWTADYRLWVAQYFDDPDLHETPSGLPAGWNDWYLWQYSDDGQLPLCPYDGVDLNKASAKLLEDLGNPPPPPSDEGDSMYKYTITANNQTGSFVNIRADHSASSADIGDLLNGQKARGDTLWQTADGSQKWLNVAEVNGAPKTGWIAVIFNSVTLCDLVENTTPPPAALPTITVTLKAAGYPDLNIEWKPNP